MPDLMKIRRNFNVHQSGDWIVYRKDDPFVHALTMTRKAARAISRNSNIMRIASIEKRTPCYLHVIPKH